MVRTGRVLATFAMALGAAWLAGCVAVPSQPPDAGMAQCRDVFARVDAAVAKAGVGDAMATRVAGFPHLRTDRFLASFAHDSLDDAQFAEWLQRLAELGAGGYRVEIANLPDDAVRTLAAEVPAVAPDRAMLQAAVVTCTTLLAHADESNRAGRAVLLSAVTVPDDYATWERVAGFYWLTRIAFSNGVRRWHDEVRETFGRPLDALRFAGEMKRYEPPGGRLSANDVAALLRRASANALRIPTPQGSDVDAVFRTYAPAYVIDMAGPADVPGELVMGEGGMVRVNTRSPVVYRRLSHAREQGRALLQLNYWLWFPERPRRGSWDLLGGAVDGLLWRVTLSPAGVPLAFDTIHPCGCYHLFFSTPRAKAKAQPETPDEPGFVPAALPPVEAGERVELWLEASNHYLRRVVVGGRRGDGAEYTFADDDSLRSLPLPGGGRRSAFRPDGIVAGTERGERWIFWPMGVAESGAMRQWGHHATAFVGRRHFDDPGLLSRYFDLAIIP